MAHVLLASVKHPPCRKKQTAEREACLGSCARALSVSDVPICSAPVSRVNYFSPPLSLNVFLKSMPRCPSLLPASPSPSALWAAERALKESHSDKTEPSCWRAALPSQAWITPPRRPSSWTCYLIEPDMKYEATRLAWFWICAGITTLTAAQLLQVCHCKCVSP